MDRTEFELLDQGYQEDRQRYLDEKSAEITPAFDERLQSANAAYVERLRVIRNSEYTIDEQQQIEQQELQIYETNMADIEAEKEAALNEAIAPDDQMLQELVFGEGGREAAERRMLEYEEVQAMQEELHPDTETETENEVETVTAETADTQDYFNTDDFDYSDINEKHASLTDEFNDDKSGPPPPSAGEGVEVG